MKLVKQILACFFVVIVVFLAERRYQKLKENVHINAYLTQEEILEKHGYAYEKYDVTTTDGYIIEIIRLYPRKITNFFKNFTSPTYKNIHPMLLANTFGEPIILAHGFTTNKIVFLQPDPEKSLAFQLANLGYDVYLTSARGVRGSRRHISLDPDRDAEKFWNFSFHEIGIYDQAAVIDFVLNKTGFAQVSIVGQSQGATAFFALASLRPNYNDKIKIAFSWAGSAVMKHPTNKVAKIFGSFEKEIFECAHYYDHHEHVVAFIHFVHWLSSLNRYIDVKFVFKFLMDQTNILGIHHIANELISVVTYNYPTPVSIKQLVHYLQLVDSRDFRMFDYHDREKNLAVYGSETPPAYNLSAITAKTILYYSDFDEFVQEEDTIAMNKIMRNSILRKIAAQKFSHADYLFANDINSIIYNEMFWYLKFL